MKKLHSVVFGLVLSALSCLACSSCTPAEMAAAKTGGTMGVSAAEMLCRDAIALGLSNAELLAVCNDVDAYAPIVTAILAARTDPAPAKARLAARMADAGK